MMMTMMMMMNIIMMTTNKTMMTIEIVSCEKIALSQRVCFFCVKRVCSIQHSSSLFSVSLWIYPIIFHIFHFHKMGCSSGQHANTVAEKDRPKSNEHQHHHEESVVNQDGSSSHSHREYTANPGASSQDDKQEHAVHETDSFMIHYPNHPERKATPLYNKTHHSLCIVQKNQCWICELKHGDMIPRSGDSDDKYGGKLVVMETHHFHCEWADANGKDWIDFGRRAAMDRLRDFHNDQLIAPLFDWKQVAENPFIFLDSPSNMMVLCSKHHRDPVCGIHHVPFPLWIMQKSAKRGFTPLSHVSKSPSSIHYRIPDTVLRKQRGVQSRLENQEEE